jgi:UPF0042 nucleotide-binding protein
MKILIISGLSGSGKSIALKALEDSGYYCIDNLPATLLPEIGQHLEVAHQARVAISVDTRSAALQSLPAHIAQLKAEGCEVQLLFLEASTESLVKRFSETRRKHPLSGGSQTLAQSINQEREMLSEIAALAHHIDTSDLSSNKLRAWIKAFIALENTAFTLLFTSFGFKYGVPTDADFIFDVRSLPNPHYDAILRPQTGLDAPVQAFLNAEEDVQAMLQDIRYYVAKWLPSFERDRDYLTVAIGCTGGQHRSVYLVEALARAFKAMPHTPQVLVRHRELA